MERQRSERPGRIVLMNGTSCAGKSTLARALQDALSEPWFRIDIDSFLDGRPTRHPGWSDADAQRRLYVGFHRAIAAFAGAGNDVVVATILPWHDPTVMARFVEVLAGFRVLFAGVTCPRGVAEERERQRDEMRVGNVRAQFDLIHRYGPYDVEVDTSAALPAECAQDIAALVERPDAWRAFAALGHRLAASV